MRIRRTTPLNGCQSLLTEQQRNDQARDAAIAELGTPPPSPSRHSQPADCSAGALRFRQPARVDLQRCAQIRLADEIEIAALSAAGASAIQRSASERR
jgi:hypothetical protein